MVNAGGGQLQDKNGHLLLWSKGWPYAHVLVCNAGGQLGDDIPEGGPMDVEGLDPLFFIPGAQDDPLPPVGAGGVGLELELSDLKVIQEHPSILGVLDGLVLIGHVKVGGLVQDAWLVQGVMCGSTQDIQLLARGWMKLCEMVTCCCIISRWGTQDVLQPLARVTQGNKQDTVQLLGLFV